MPKKDSALTKIEQLEDQHLQDKFELLTDAAKEQRKNQALMIIGGVRVANRIARSINSQVMNALIMFQDDQMYQSFGYKTFVEFLTESEYAPMTKHEFYARKGVFEKEGEDLFDLMEEIGVSLSVRKLLSDGDYDAISIEGDKIFVGNETADLSNFRMVKTLIESFAVDNKKLKDENKKKTSSIEALENKVTKLHDEVQSFKNPAAKKAATQIFEAYLNAESALEQLIKTVKSAPLEVREQSSSETFIRSLYVRFCGVKESFGRGDMNLETKQVEGEFSGFLSKLNDDELSDLME